VKTVKLRLGVLLAVSSLTVVGCGQPSQKYATSKSEGVYFTVPVGWHQVSMKELNEVEVKSTIAGAAEKLSLVEWQEAYSPNSKIGPLKVFSIQPTAEPLVFVRVRWLFPEEVNDMSYNTLRDMVEPLTEWVNNPDETTPEYNIIDDYEVTQKGGRGVRTVFSFVYNDTSQTIDQTALMSMDGQKVYLLVSRCTTKCYQKNSKVLEKIAASFTVRGTK